MKSAPLALAVIIGALTFTQSAYANQNNSPTATGNQAAVLATKPVTLTGRWGFGINRNNNFKTNTNSIALEPETGCKKLNPFDIIKNPNILFKQCQQPTNYQPSLLAEMSAANKLPTFSTC